MGLCVGFDVGTLVGMGVGTLVGFIEGDSVGDFVGQVPMQILTSAIPLTMSVEITSIERS